MPPLLLGQGGAQLLADVSGHLGKLAPAVEGVFLWIHLHPGGTFKHEYKVAELKEFEADSATDGNLAYYITGVSIACVP